MTDQDKKLLALHEKLDAKDAELDQVKAELAELKQKTAVDAAKRGKWDWLVKNPAMLAALTGILAGVGTTAENLWTRYLDEKEDQARLEQKKQEEQVDDQSVGKLSELLVKRQDEVEEVCLAHAQAIVAAMPAHQRRRAERWLHDREYEVIWELTPDPPEPTPVSVATSSMVGAEQAAPEKPSNVYEVIQQQVKSKGDSLALDELEDVLQSKGRLKKRVTRKHSKE